MLEIKDATYWAEQLKSGNLSAKALLEMTNDKIQSSIRVTMRLLLMI